MALIQPDISDCQLDEISGEHFRVYSISLKKIFEIVQENTVKFSKLIWFLGNKKSSLNQNVRRDHATMQQDVLLHFLVIFLYWNEAKLWKNYSVVQL